MVYAKYLGGGFLPDVPARDLIKQEFDALSSDQQAAVLSSGLYQIAALSGKTAQKDKEDASAVKGDK